ncbi:amidase [Arthrobacter sp. KNU40]|uniref:amidase n=1 Tax=Arthrobacter sp. KNU40 TaxID=3447965 RepID=UPI003F5D8FB7
MTITTVEELTITQVHDALLAGTFTVRELVEAYLERIRTLDAEGPALNSIVTVSGTALEEADAQDAYLAANGTLSGPLHGVPVVVKDQIETAGIPTSFGSAATGAYTAAQDATAIAQLRTAGAIILAKTTMPDFATSWFSTSSRSGITRNPYDLARDPGGSSSGSAAAVAANLALVGIGEDTGGSIRLPCSFCNVVGLRVTPGLISRTGMSSLVVPQDTAGPITRTVTDAAVVLDALVGFDPKDPYTAAYAIARHSGTYAEAVAKDGLAGKRIGVLRQAFGPDSDAESAAVNDVIRQALAKVEAAGAQLVDVEVPNLNDYVADTSVYFSRSRQDMNAFIAKRPELGIDSIEQLHAEGKFHEKLDLFVGIATGPATAKEDPTYPDRVALQGDFQRLVAGIMAEQKLDAICFPDVKLAAPSHEDIFADRWTCLTYPTNTVIASQLLFPAITVPAGFTSEGLPVGLEIMALPYSEPQLLGLAHGVEKATAARKAPNLSQVKA